MSNPATPVYLQPGHREVLRNLAVEAPDWYRCCELCPRRCRINRERSLAGFCRTGVDTPVSSSGAHFGEEDVLVGQRGSGTVFFSGCNLQCVFCQNCDIAMLHNRGGLTADELADVFLAIQQEGCHNLNLVTPTHVLPGILAALDRAVDRGFRLPVVYNTSGYERAEIIRRLAGVIDIWMPDLKTLDRDLARHLLSAGDYPRRMMEAVRVMQDASGDLQLDADGVACRGVLFRHLVMPGQWEDSRNVLQFIREISTRPFVNIMDQYRPCRDRDTLRRFGMDRPLSADEFSRVVRFAASIQIVSERQSKEEE